ncbi:proline-rich protein 36-like [Schistocerca piceifrons]|uniref:proline-rich protein 36-like n=1 Tax=Schistocerca piceifrons TaxID=274613 RepID=UPI001F5FA47C|nr:proline-rich protein 36-like [Schistocerca piceifrons]
MVFNSSVSISNCGSILWNCDIRTCAETELWATGELAPRTQPSSLPAAAGTVGRASQHAASLHTSRRADGGLAGNPRRRGVADGGRRPPVAPVSLSTRCTSLLLLCERAFPGRPPTLSCSRISVDPLHVTVTPLCASLPRAAADPQSLPYLCRPAARRCYSSVSEPSQGGRRPPVAPGGRRPPVAPVSVLTHCTSPLLLCVQDFQGEPPTPSRSRISVDPLHVTATPLCASLPRAAADPQSLPYLCRPAARRCYSSVSEPSQGGRRPPVAPVSLSTRCMSLLLLCVRVFPGRPPTPSRSRISVDLLHVAATPLSASLPRAAADPQLLPYLCRPAACHCYSSVCESSQGGRRPPEAPVSLSTCCTSLLLLCERAFPGRPPTPSCSRISVDPLHVTVTPLCASLLRAAADPQSLPYLCRPAARRCYSSVSEPSQGGRRPPVAPVSLSTRCMSLLLLCVRVFPGRPPTPSRSRISVDLLHGGRRPPVAPVSVLTHCTSPLLLCVQDFQGEPPTPSRSRISVDPLHVTATPLCASLLRAAADPQSLPYLCRPAARRCYSSGGRRPPVAPVSVLTHCTSPLLLCVQDFQGEPPTPSRSRISVDPLHVAATPLCASLLRAAADPQSLPYLCRPAARRCYSSGGRRPPVAPVSVLTHCTSPLLLCVQDFQGEPLTPSRSRISVDPLHVAATPLCASLLRAAADPQSLPYLCRPAARRCYSSVSEPSQGGRRPPVAPVSLSTRCTSLLLLCVRAFSGRPPTPSRSRICVDLLHVAATPL